MQNKKKFWTNVIGEDWYNLNPALWESSHMEKLLSAINDRYAKTDVFPNKKDIFKPFRLCPLKNLKVIILGEGPLIDGSSTGLAFANDGELLTPTKEMIKIRNAVEKSCYDGFKISFDITLEEWAEQGVLLLNITPTIEKYGTINHDKIWLGFVKSIMLSLKSKPGLHYCLWGVKAKQYKSFINESQNYVYENIHPNDEDEWECNDFIEINRRIIKNNGMEDIIAW